MNIYQSELIDIEDDELYVKKELFYINFILIKLLILDA